jgi:UDP-glucuronate decarboxylase
MPVSSFSGIVNPVHSEPNLAHKTHWPSHNIQDALPDLVGVHQIYNLACPASPVHYQKDPVSTLNTCFLGTQNLLELARSKRIRILHTSTSG